MRIPLGQSERFLLFGRNFLKHPRMLGSVIPSSRFLVNRLLAPVDWTRARVIVEYGPGVGTVTTEILRRMAPDAVLVAIETNADFVRFLRRRIHDPRLRLVHGSAANADDESRVLAPPPGSPGTSSRTSSARSSFRPRRPSTML